MTEAIAPSPPVPAVPPLTDAAAITAAAMKLPPKDREWLAEQLWVSVDREAEQRAAEGEIVDPSTVLGPGWLEEIQRRVAEIERGEAVLLDGEEVMRELRAKYSA